MIIELRPESVVQIEKSSGGAEEVPNVPNVPNVLNDDASTEVLQIVEQDHEEVEEPQVSNILFSRRFLFFLVKKKKIYVYIFINSS